jgi:hypothetical protein
MQLKYCLFLILKVIQTKQNISVFIEYFLQFVHFQINGRTKISLYIGAICYLMRSYRDMPLTFTDISLLRCRLVKRVEAND